MEGDAQSRRVVQGTTRRASLRWVGGAAAKDARNGQVMDLAAWIRKLGGSIGESWKDGGQPDSVNCTLTIIIEQYMLQYAPPTLGTCIFIY